MNRCKATFLASSLSVLLLLANVSLAQEPAAPAPPAQTKVSLDEIRALVKKLDPNAQEAPNNRDGKLAFTRFSFQMKVGNDTLFTVFDVHSHVLWMSCTLSSPISDLSKLPQGLLVDMLKAHVQTGPSFLRLMNTNQGYQLQMGHRLDLTCTMDRLVSGINEMAGDIQNTRPLWTQVK